MPVSKIVSQEVLCHIAVFCPIPNEQVKYSCQSKNTAGCMTKAAHVGKIHLHTKLALLLLHK